MARLLTQSLTTQAIPALKMHNPLAVNKRLRFAFQKLFRFGTVSQPSSKKIRRGRIERIQLADLISDTEATVRDLLDHLDLPFAPEYLRFHESDRPVFTPSAEQVRRPINRDADALVAGFAPFVDDLRAALGDLAAAR